MVLNNSSVKNFKKLCTNSLVLKIQKSVLKMLVLENISVKNNPLQL